MTDWHPLSVDSAPYTRDSRGIAVEVRYICIIWVSRAEKHEVETRRLAVRIPSESETASMKSSSADIMAVIIFIRRTVTQLTS